MYSQIRENNDIPTKQTIQHLQGGPGPRDPADVLHGARGAARDGARRDAGGGGRAGAVGGLRGARMLQVHGSQRRGGQGLLHGLHLRWQTTVAIEQTLKQIDKWNKDWINPSRSADRKLCSSKNMTDRHKTT